MKKDNWKKILEIVEHYYDDLCDGCVFHNDDDARFYYNEKAELENLIFIIKNEIKKNTWLLIKKVYYNNG